jgi:putative SOS response-associated peptidase YedK
VCGRYVSPDDAAIEREFNLIRSPGLEVRANYNVAPTLTVPVVRSIDGVRQASMMRWGLIPFFAKGVPGTYGTHIARAETIDTKPSYRGSWKYGRRCIVPVAGFYEWQVLFDGKSKQPFHIRAADQDVYGLAGIWDASKRDDGSIIESFAVITVSANPLMAEIHNGREDPRMPLMLRREDYETWLTGNVQEAQAMLKPYPSEWMTAWPVSARVNKVGNNDAELLARV